MINFVRLFRILSFALMFAFLAGQSASAQSLLLPDGGMNPLSNDFRYNIIGDLSVSDLLLAPTFIYQETEGADKSHSGFAPGQSYAAVTWRRDRFLLAVFKVGSKTLIGTPARYAAPSTSDELGLIEAYGQVDFDYGRFRFGLVPIPFGLEGGDAEARLRFPRSLLFRLRLINIRDYGISYRITSQGFFTDWAIHNGEGGPDLDNEAWLTARWGWQGFNFLRLGFSGTVGRTDPKSTNPTGTANSDTLASMVIEDFSRVRIANFFAWWDTHPIRVAFEATTGDTQQGGTNHQLKAFHGDFEYEAGQNWSFLARYDTANPNVDFPNNTFTEVSAGLAWRSLYENSVVTLIGSKEFHEDPKDGYHRVLLSWKITPSVVRLHSFL